MTWNIFKRIAQLEQQVKDLTDFNGDKSRWLGRLEEKIRNIENKLFIQAVERNAFSAAPVRSEGKQVFTMSKVEQEKERNRQYQRERYAIRKNDKAAREKKNAYARAYYARTKGAKK